MNKSFRADGKEEIVLKVLLLRCGSCVLLFLFPSFCVSLLFFAHVPPLGRVRQHSRLCDIGVAGARDFSFFSRRLNGRQASSTYTVNVISEDKFQSVIDQLKEKAGAQCRADEVFGVDKKSGNKIKFDPSRTIEENGITPTSHPIMRFPSKFAGKMN
jgi:hypothetical protein